MTGKRYSQGEMRTPRDITDGLAHDHRPDTHHWTHKREGSLGNEPTFVQHCIGCGSYYRHGEVTER